MNQASILNTLANNLHSFASQAQTLNNYPRDIRKALVEKRRYYLQGQVSFCLCIWGITPIYAGKINDQIRTLADALEKVRRVAQAKNYLCGKNQAINNACDEVDSAFRELNKTVEHLRSTALHSATEAAISA